MKDNDDEICELIVYVSIELSDYKYTLEGEEFILLVIVYIVVAKYSIFFIQKLWFLETIIFVFFKVIIKLLLSKMYLAKLKYLFFNLKLIEKTE